MSKLTDKITTILKEDINYAPQVQGFVVHGAIEKLENLFKEEMIKLLEWTFSDGYPVPDGVSYKIEIKESIYTIPEAVNIFLNTKTDNNG